MSGAAKWRVLIADDEPAARRGVRQLLAPYTDFVVAGECRDGRELGTALDAHAADALFLDIQMPEANGLDVIRGRPPESLPAVVFLTAYDQFALRAFDAEAIDYLVKPVSEARFAATMNRLRRRLASGERRLPEPSIMVATSRGAVVLRLQEIDWIEAADNYARLWAGTRSYLLRESLAQLEDRVTPHGFARAHRKALLRVNAVRALSSENGELMAVLANGARIPVSRRRRASLFASLRDLGKQ